MTELAEIERAGAMRILANLDIEARWGGVHLKSHVLRRISSAAALLAGFAPDGVPIEIFTPVDVDPTRVRIENVALRVGTPTYWDLAWADPAAKQVNDRRWTLALRDELGVPLPGARVLHAVEELDGTRGRWVCKAPWTAAGRDRAHGEDDGNAELRVYLGRLIQRFGAVVFEPWLDRILDVGVTGSVSAHDVALDGIHTLLSDPRGGFLGIDLAPPPLTDEEASRLLFIARAVGRRLALAGYHGPFTVDAFVHRDGATRALHPLCELNARYTFGHVARAWARRAGATKLGFGDPPDGARVLVAPSDDDRVTAWIA